MIKKKPSLLSHEAAAEASPAPLLRLEADTVTDPESKFGFIPIIPTTAVKLIHSYRVKGQRSSQTTRPAQPMLPRTHLIIHPIHPFSMPTLSNFGSQGI